MNPADMPAGAEMTEALRDALNLDMSIAWAVLEPAHKAIDIPRIRRGWKAMRAALKATE